ncbi:MAG: hypothetical protein ACRD5L_04700, partial [Bryobacteraceae bacterium]
GGLTITEPDEHSQQWLHWVCTSGVALETLPSRIFGAAAFGEFRRHVFRHYQDWLHQGYDFTRSSTDPTPYRFGRSPDYLRQRYPRLRDWMNHALTGERTSARPTWDLRLPVPPPLPTGASVLTDFVLGQEVEDDGHDLLPGEVPGPAFFPNMLGRIAQDAFIHLQKFFLVAASEAPTGISYQRVEQELHLMLVVKGMLRALLTEIGDIPCTAAEAGPEGA